MADSASSRADAAGELCRLRRWRKKTCDDRQWHVGFCACRCPSRHHPRHTVASAALAASACNREGNSETISRFEILTRLPLYLDLRVGIFFKRTSLHTVSTPSRSACRQPRRACHLGVEARQRSPWRPSRACRGRWRRRGRRARGSRASNPGREPQRSAAAAAPSCSPSLQPFARAPPE